MPGSPSAGAALRAAARGAAGSGVNQRALENERDVLAVVGRNANPWRYPDTDARADCHEARPGSEDPAHEVARQDAVDLLGAARSLLRLVAARVEHIHVKSVLMRKMPRSPVLHPEVATSP